MVQNPSRFNDSGAGGLRMARKRKRNAKPNRSNRRGKGTPSHAGREKAAAKRALRLKLRKEGGDSSSSGWKYR